MTLKALLDRLEDLGADRAPREAADLNLSLLKRCLDEGYEAHAAMHLAGGFGPWQAHSVLVSLEKADDRQSIPVCLGPESLPFLRSRLSHLPVSSEAGAATEASPAAPSALVDELRAQFGQTEDLSPEERAARLMDWIMERIDASRCALIPFEAGTPAPPLAFHLRGQPPGSLNPARVPRAVVKHVATTRQPIVNNDTHAVDSPVPHSESLHDQQVRSYMAVPVVFRGELLAVCYVDRLWKPRRFGADARASFQAFAYELATPLLALRDVKRRLEYRELRDSLLARKQEPLRLVSSRALEPVLERARQLAAHGDENLLLLGESGVGKEVVARFIHEASGRGSGPFVPVNVGAIPAELFESELMGSVRGAYTGAETRAGWIVQAAGGTLFLDELGDLGLVNQVKLLRFLQDKRVVALGGHSPRQVDVRVIAATNRPLGELLRRGEFREDVYHRFAPPLTVPPLRERVEEILPHAETWLEHKARQAGVRVPRLTPEARQFLSDYSWPGNVRQLQTVLSHALLLAEGRRIGRRLLESLTGPQEVEQTPGPVTWEAWRSQRVEQEKQWLREVLDSDGGNAEAAARRLGCPASTLRTLIRKHGIR